MATLYVSDLVIEHLLILLPAQYTSGAGEGSLIDESGRVLLEQHRGLWNYTVGQRARIAGLPGRWFVARKGVGLRQNDILVVPGG